MKKFFTLFAMVLISLTAFADSYTITFKSGVEEADASYDITTKAAIADLISEGAEYVSGFNLGGASASKVYMGKQGTGLKFGSSKAVGQLVFDLSAKGIVKATKITVNVASWQSTAQGNPVDKCYPTVNGKALSAAAIQNEAFADYAITMDGETEVSSLTITASQAGRFYVKSITVEYGSEASTLNDAIAKAVAGGAAVLDLQGGSYDLNGTAELPATGFTIKNGTIVADATGNLAAQSKLVLENVKIDATAAPEGSARTIAPIQLSANPDASLYNQTDPVYYTEEEAAAYNAEHAEEIAAGTLTAVTTESVKTAAAPKNPNATWKGYIADEVSIINSEIKTAAPLIRTAAAWSLKNLNIEKSLVEVTYKSGKAVLDFEENAAGLIQNINIKESTLFADDEATEMRFLRYAAQNDPWRVWGYEGEDKNVTKDTWTMESNTIVNLCGNKEFANNVKNAATTVLTWKKNVFANSWRLQKVGTNCTRNFTAEDNSIAGGLNPVDGTDASKWATEDIYMGVKAGEFSPAEYSWTTLKQYGDPRWLKEYVPFSTLNAAIEKTVALGASVLDLQGGSYDLNGTAELPATGFTIKNGTIVADATGNLAAQSKLVLENVKIDATAAPEGGARTIAPIQLSANPDASLYNQTDPVYYTEEEAAAYNAEHAEEIAAGTLTAVTTESVKTAAAPKNPNATWKGYIADEVSIINSEIKTAAPLIRTAAAWSLKNLNIEKSLVEVTYKSGKAVLDFEENAAGLIQNINIKESTLFADDEASDMRFLRYASQNDPWRVWGYEGEDKNVTKDTWTMESNTIVNLCGNKEFANNVKNAATTVLTWKKNVFANSWRLQKVGTNCTREFTAEDNAIIGGTNPVDGTDASKWATEDIYMGVKAGEFSPAEYSWTTLKKYGDPRWLKEYVPFSTLNAAIEKTVALGASVLDLQGGSYDLNGTAELPATGFTIKNGTIVADATGNLAAQSKLVLENVKIEATAAPEGGARTIAPIQLSANPDASLYNQTDPVYYTEEEAAAYNAEHAEEIAAGTLTAVTTESVKTAAAPKDPNATWKGYIAQEVSIINSEIKTAAPLIRTAAAWSLKNLNIEKSLVEVTYKSGKAVLDFEENAAGLIQNINIKESTLFADDEASDMRFLRYASQNDPWRVWGYEGDDNKVTTDTWTMESNTIVNLCGNKEFANNVKNAATTVLTWKKNVFANSWRLQKVGTNCARNFTAEDNSIAGGLNPVDGTDASKWATEDARVSTNFDVAKGEFFINKHSYAAKMQYGDPKWLVAYEEPAKIAQVVTIDGVLAQDTIYEDVELGGKYEKVVERAYTYNGVVYDLISYGDSIVGQTFVIDPIVADTTIVNIKLATPIVAPADAKIKYYWKSNFYVTELGGQMSVMGADKNGNPEPQRLNYLNANYYTICLNGAKDYTQTYMSLALDNALAAGDTIYVTAYKNKGDATKEASVKIRANGETYDSGNVFNDIAIDNQLPNQIAIIVPASMNGATVVDFTRGITGTNLFITELVIKEGEKADAINSVNANASNNGVRYNISGQRVNDSAKGIVIINGKKILVK